MERMGGCRAEVENVWFQVDYWYFPPRDDADIDYFNVYLISDTKQEYELTDVLNQRTLNLIEDQIYESIARGDDL